MLLSTYNIQVIVVYIIQTNFDNKIYIIKGKCKILLLRCYLLHTLYIDKFSIMSFQTDKNLARTFLNIIVIFFYHFKFKTILRKY